MAVDMWLPLAEQVEVRSVEDEDEAGHRGLLAADGELS
jgi:hypothetical protein